MKARPPLVGLVTLFWLIPTTAALGWLLGGGGGGGNHDPLQPVRNALQEQQLEREQLTGWLHQNAALQAGWKIQHDPELILPLLPSGWPTTQLITRDGAYLSNLSAFYRGVAIGWDFSTVVNRSLALQSHLNLTTFSQLLSQHPIQNASVVQVAPEVNLTQVEWHRGQFDWFSTKGNRISINIDEEQIVPDKVSVVRGAFGLQSTKGSPLALEFDLNGLHFLETGTLILVAQDQLADREIDLRDVVALLFQDQDQQSRNLTATAIDNTLEEREKTLQAIIDSGRYDPGKKDNSDVPTKPSHNCTLHIYAKLESTLAPIMQPLLDELEHETVEPTGISTIPEPPLRMSTTIYSPECQFILSSDNIQGLTKPKLWNKAVDYAAVFFVVLLIQVHLLVDQMERTRTPSGLAKVSYWTFALQCALDAYIGFGHLAFAISIDNVATSPLIACAFMSNMLFLAFEYRYALTIFRTQAPEYEEPVPTAAAVAAPTPPQHQTEGDTANPNPTTPTATTTDDAATASQARDGRRTSLLLLAFGLVLFLIGFFPILVAAALFPVLYSFWLPQIYRNIQKGTRKAVRIRCVIGTSLCRLFLPLYILACPPNILLIEPSKWVYLLICWVLGQTMLLLLQDLLGPHFFLPARWIPANAAVVWDWHPPISTLRRFRSEDTEANVNTDEDDTLGDCAICLCNIEPTTFLSSTISKPKTIRSDKSGHYYSSIREEEDQEMQELEQELVGHTYPPETNSFLHFQIPTFFTRTFDTLRNRFGSDSLKTSDTQVMVAPCNHIFHTACLEQWMMIKTECPSCRRPLPPI